MVRRYCVRRLLLFVVIAAVGPIAGCGGGTGALKGGVTFNGKPVVAGTVTVFASDGAVYLGEIQSDGTYQVCSIATGPAKVTVYSPDRTRLIGLERQAMLERKATAAVDAKESEANANADEASPRVNPPGWMKLPEKYADAATTDLSTEVARGTNTYDIALQ